MSAVAIEQFVTPEEYIAFEEAADYNSEYINGRIYAMASASEPHIVISTNLTGEVRSQLRERDCRVYGGDLRVKAIATTAYFHPDVTVVCGERHFDTTKTATLFNPTVIFEVLSPTTEGYDRGDKFLHYQRIASLREYVLVSHNRVRVECFTRNGDGWTYTDLQYIEAILFIASADCRIALRDIYQFVVFPKVAEPARLPDEKD